MTGPGAPDAQPTQDSRADDAEVEREHVRGSSLMVVGRLLSVALNLVVQVTAVRYLGKTDYGVFAYAIAVSSFGSSAALLGQDQALSRFLARYDEEGDAARARGAVTVAFAVVGGVGAAIAAAVIGLHGLGVDLPGDDAAAPALVILIATVPLLGLDELFLNLFAVMARPTAIFFRRFVLTPGLRVASIGFVVATSGTVTDLAWAYLLSGVLGLLAYAAMFRRVAGDHAFAHRGPSVRPVREMLSFGGPVYASDMVIAARRELVVILLGVLRSVRDVATFRAVYPVAALNAIGTDSFRLLYFPVASRLFLRDERDTIRRLYWQSAAWIAVGTFPVFVVTTALAEPLTRLLFGSEFDDSAEVLAVVAAGIYVSSAFGLTTHTLRASGRLRLLLVIDGVSLAVGLVASVVLIETSGAFGAALATAGSTILNNVLVYAGLWRVLDGLPMPREHRRTYASIAAGTAAVAALQLLVDPPFAVGVVGSAAVAVSVVVANRRALDVGATFPALARLPLVGRFLTASPGPDDVPADS